MKDIFYKEISDECLIFKYAFQNKLPLMLKGPTGCGKSRFVEKMANDLNIKLIQIACNEETSSVDLQGRYLIQSGNTIWQDGPATTAVKNGNILYLDEISEAREDVIVVIHPLSDHRREIYIDKKNENIKASDNFMLIASYNPGYQSKSKDLKISTKQRFITISFDYPNENIEVEIITKESGVDINNAKNLVSYANKLRNLNNLELLDTVSTRLLVNAGKLIRSGLNKKLACEVSIIQTLTDDQETQISLRDIMNLII
jgi:nitric oxide reductase NorQ protein